MTTLYVMSKIKILQGQYGKRKMTHKKQRKNEVTLNVHRVWLCMSLSTRFNITRPK